MTTSVASGVAVAGAGDDDAGSDDAGSEGDGAVALGTTELCTTELGTTELGTTDDAVPSAGDVGAGGVTGDSDRLGPTGFEVSGGSVLVHPATPSAQASSRGATTRDGAMTQCAGSADPAATAVPIRPGEPAEGQAAEGEPAEGQGPKGEPTEGQAAEG